MLGAWRARRASAPPSRSPGREVAITNPGRSTSPRPGSPSSTSCSTTSRWPTARSAARAGGPNVLVRYADGIHGEFFYQKRAPAHARTGWRASSSASRRAGSPRRSCRATPPRLAWMANLGCLELHPHPVRAEDLEHPDELRIDLDPVPGVEWSQLVAVAEVVRAALGDLGLVGWPKTSGSRGIHVNVRIHRRWSFGEVRRAALALAREVERRAPTLATSKWWKEERHGVFLDYNQNAKDRTVAQRLLGASEARRARLGARDVGRSSPRATPETSRSARCPPASPRSATATPASTRPPCSLDSLLELSRADEAEGLGDAPWPPHYAEAAGRAGSRRAVAAEERRKRRRPPRLDEAARRDRARGPEGRTRWPGSSGGRRATRRRPAPSGPRTSSSTRCAAARRRGPASASTSEHVPEALRPAQEPLDPDGGPSVGAGARPAPPPTARAALTPVSRRDRRRALQLIGPVRRSRSSSAGGVTSS